MEVTKVTEVSPSFQPFSLHIRFEHLLEAERFYAIFNTPAITGGSKLTVQADAIREALSMKYGNAVVYGNLSKALHRAYKNGATGWSGGGEEESSD